MADKISTIPLLSFQFAVASTVWWYAACVVDWLASKGTFCSYNLIFHPLQSMQDPKQEI
jgi:hypothetical protein